MKFTDTNHEIIKHPLGYTVKVYIDNGPFQSSGKLYFDGATRSEAMAKAQKHFAKPSTSKDLKKGSLYDLI